MCPGGLTTPIRECSSAVERYPSKLDVVGSIPITRSDLFLTMPYNKTYHEIKDILKSAKKVDNDVLLDVTRLALKEALVKEDFDWSTVTMETKFAEDLDADSLDLVELVMFLEECFSIEIADEYSMEIVTVGDAIEVIKKCKKEKGKPRKIDKSKYTKRPAPGSPIGVPKVGQTQPDLEPEIKEALEEDET